MSLETELQAIQQSAAISPLTDRAFLRITGSDATRWLNGMVTNNIKDLTPGQGNYNFLLNAQGRIQADCTIYREPTEGEANFLLATDKPQLETIQTLLDKFIIMDDVEMSIVDDLNGVLVIGTQALAVVTNLGTANCQAAPCATPPQTSQKQGLYLKRTLYANAQVLLVQSHQGAAPSYEIWSDSSTSAAILAELREGRSVELSHEALEAHRILSGTPRFSTDIRTTDLPQETNQIHALHFAKGCYLGQEIVERIRSRGQVHRSFTRFTLEGELPTEFPAPLTANAKPAGEITSAVRVGDTLYALGYARREALELKQPLSYPGGIALPRTA